MENRRKPVEKVDSVQLLKQISQRLIETLKPVGNRIGKMSFWGMALLCFFLRLFVVHPLGAMLALISSSIWLYWNFHGVRLALLKVLSGLTSAMGGNEQRSLWYDNEGREKIRDLIARLSKQGIHYCNLVVELPDFPSENHWYAISNGLKEMGVLSQASRHAFYIYWPLQEGADPGMGTNPA